MSAATSSSRPPAGRLRRAWDHDVFGFVLKLVVGYVVLVEGAIQLLFGKISLLGFAEVGFGPQSIPRGVFLIGAVVGALYAFVGMGLVLVYRANRIINFAQAQLGAVPAVLALLLIARRGLNYWLAIPILVVGALALGAAVEVGVVRRFKDASRLVLTVATIGVGFLLLVVEHVVKNVVTGELSITTDFPTPFQGFELNVGVVTLYGDHFVTFAVSIAVLVGLALFFRYTDIGVAVRAAAENRARALLLGIPVDRVSTVVWALAGLLSGIAVFLRAPIIGLPLAGFVGPVFLIYGLAAAVIARMEKLPTALLAGLFIGTADVSAVFATSRSSLSTAVMLVVILVALLAQRRKLGRAVREGTSWQSVQELRRIPAELRGLREVRTARAVLVALVVVAALAVPWIVGDAKTNFATLTVIYAMVGVSLVVLTGWAGQISLGQFAIAGIGAAVAGGLAANHQMDFFLTIALAAAAGALVAVLIGLPALRIQGLFLAVTTLAFAFAVPAFVLRKEFFPWLLPAEGRFAARPILYERMDMTQPSEVLGLTIPADAKWYLLCLVFLALALAVARSVRRYRSGRVFIGVRDNARLLQAFGVGPAGTRLAAFAISGAIAAVAGALLAYDQGSVDPLTYAPEQSILLFAMTVLGGITSLAGPVIGAVFLQAIPLAGLKSLPVVGEFIDVLLLSLGVLVVLYFSPGGIAEAFTRLRDRWLTRLADRHGIVVPSLVADVRTGDSDDDALTRARDHARDHARQHAEDNDGERDASAAGGADETEPSLAGSGS